MANNNKEQYRNVVDTSLVAGNSDDRLPSSLLTLEEYYQSLAIAQECSLNKDKQNINRAVDHIKYIADKIGIDHIGLGF